MPSSALLLRVQPFQWDNSAVEIKAALMYVCIIRHIVVLKSLYVKHYLYPKRICRGSAFKRAEENVFATCMSCGRQVYFLR
jgi:hypothetical protein